MMDQPNSFGSRSKASAQRSKGSILQWIASILSENEQCPTIQSLGTGEVYCKIMNHYFPGIISSNRIISSPSNEYEYSINLKLFQRSLIQAKINLPFDIQKISRLKFSQNWALIISLHKILDGNEITKDVNEVKTPKRSVPVQSQVLETKKTLKQNNSVVNQQSTKTDNPGLGSFISQIERIKQILIGSYNDTYKVVMIKQLFGIVEVKVEEDYDTYVKQKDLNSQLNKK